MIYFSFASYWWFYVGFTALVLLLLALDLGVLRRGAREVSFREATVWSIVWIALALAFNYAFYLYSLARLSGAAPGELNGAGSAEQVARQLGLEFLTGYVVEKSLSIDNVFVFVVVFGYFGIPARYQQRVLLYGIIGALLFRAIFIAMGSVLLQYHWIILLFGIFLILTGVKMMLAPEQKIEPEKNPLIRLFRRYMPVTAELHGERFFVRQNGVRHATPLFLTLLFIEITDVIFAVDSVPAIFALTREPLIVCTSNVFAILGLRSLYFLLAGAVDQFYLLKYGLAIVLIFVGLKMAWLNDAFDGKFPVTWSLGIIFGIIAASVIASLLWRRTHPGAGHGAS